MRWLLLTGIIFCSLRSNAQRSLMYPDSLQIVGQFMMIKYPGSDLEHLFAKQFQLNVLDNPCEKQDANLFAQRINHLPGLFCKIEYHLETKSKLAPRFRLGSLKYTEWMEGKGEFLDRY